MDPVEKQNLRKIILKRKAATSKGPLDKPTKALAIESRPMEALVVEPVVVTAPMPEGMISAAPSEDPPPPTPKRQQAPHPLPPGCGCRRSLR